MSLFKKRARIVRDTYLGYEVQFKVWWWPFWVIEKANTFNNVDDAENYAIRNLDMNLCKVVKYVKY